jgi:hypothetical protein
MKSLGKFLTIATLTVGIAASVAPMASACGVGGCGVLNQSAVVGSTLLQPSLIDTGCSTLTQPAVIDTGCSTLTQPAIVDTGMCNTCGFGTGFNTLVQPSIIDSSYALPPVMYYGGFRRRLFGNWF